MMSALRATLTGALPLGRRRRPAPSIEPAIPIAFLAFGYRHAPVADGRRDRNATFAIVVGHPAVECRDARGITEAGRSRVAARSPEIRR